MLIREATLEGKIDLQQLQAQRPQGTLLILSAVTPRISSF